jgi:uncharacterized protein YkwD
LKPHLWKLGLAAGMIWLVILTQYNAGQSTVEPAETAVVLQHTPPPQENSPVEVTTAQAMTAIPPSPTPTNTPTPLPVLHIIEAGEMPLSIAAQYRIDVELLMQINNITDPTSLQIGQQLVIPVAVTPPPDITATPTAPRTSPTPTAAPQSYLVQKGDILLTIAEEYDTTVEAIMIANDITDPRSLRVGQELIIPPDKGSPLGVKTIIHEITGGDTLLWLAQRYGSTLDDIMATNPDLEATSLQIGQKIIVPLTQPHLNPNANPTLPRISTPAESPPALVALAQTMIDDLNAQRQVAGLLPLAADEQLGALALAHAQDMVARGYFSHVTLEGLTLRDRTEARGLNLNWVGENIQRNTRSPEEAAHYAVEWFMGSRPHRNNILHDHFEHVGAGVAEGPPGWYTFVLVFAGDL